MTGPQAHLGEPPWFAAVRSLLATAGGHDLSRFLPPPGHPRRSAILVLFGQGPLGPDLLLTERASTLRSHAGQCAFPGGRVDPGDDGPVAAALREAAEETGLDPAGVSVAGTLPDLYLPPSDYAVTPVAAWWRLPSPVGVVDPAEVARVVRVPIAALTDPSNRFRVSHPSGFVGPGFAVEGLFVWGFTAGLIDRILALTGWEVPWDAGRIEQVPLEPDPARLDRRPAGGAA